MIADGQRIRLFTTNSRVASGRASSIKSVPYQTCSSIRCGDPLGNKRAAESTFDSVLLDAGVPYKATHKPTEELCRYLNQDYIFSYLKVEIEIIYDGFCADFQSGGVLLLIEEGRTLNPEHIRVTPPEKSK